MESFTDALNQRNLEKIRVCRTHPGLYDMQSAPWYTGILYYGIFTIVPLIIAIIIKLFLWRKLKQKK